MELLLVRHAEVVGDARGRCYGRLDVPLSEEGHRHARALAERLSGEDIAAFVSSPSMRALDTATPIAASRGVPVTKLDELCELDFGEVEGLTFEEIATTWPELYSAWMTAPAAVAFPGGEAYADLSERVLEAVSRLRAVHQGRRVVAVTHAGVVRTVLAEVLEVPVAALFRVDIDPASVTRVEWRTSGPVVRGVNAIC